MNTKPESQPPSDEFARAFCHSGSPVATCEFCNRVHFDSTGQCMEEGELDALLEKQKQNPKKYFALDEGISWGHIDGRQFVWGCPCNAISRFEDFVWRHRLQIAEYLKTRAKQRLSTAVEEDRRLSTIPT